MSTYFCSNSLIMNWAAALLTPALAQADLWLGARGGWQRLSALQPAGLLLLLYPASPGNCGDMLHTRLFVWQTSISSVSHTANSSWSLQHSMAVAVWLQTCPHWAVSSERCQRQESASSDHPLGSDSFHGGVLLQLHCLIELPQAFIPIPCPFPGSEEMAPSQQLTCSVLCLRLN